MVIFNNGQYLFERTPQSYVLEIDGFRDGQGNSAGRYVNPPSAGYTQVQYPSDTQKSPRKISNQIVWSYSAKTSQGFFSHIGSGCQRLPNGNTLICSTAAGQIFEVTAAGELVWDYVNPVTKGGVLEALSDSYPTMNAVFRAYRYGPDHPALSGKTLTSQGTITSLRRKIYLPFVSFNPGTSTTGIAMVNPTSESITAQLTAYDGGVLSLPAHGCLYLDVATLFKSAAFDGYLRLRSSGGIIANALIRFGSETLSSANLVPVSQAATQLYAPHVIQSQGLYYSEISLVNPGDAEASVTLSPFNSDGTSMTAAFSITVPARQMRTLRNEALGLSSTAAADGWILVKSSAGSPLIGSLTIGNPVDDHYESLLPLQSAGSREFYFGQVANGAVGGVSYWTGIAVLNTSSLPSRITFRIYHSSGELNGKEATVTLLPGRKYVGLLSQLPGIGTLAGQSRGYLHVAASEPVFAFELFGDSSNTFLSVVPIQY